MDEFVESKNYSTLPVSDQFEHFTNFCIINKEYDSVSFDEQEISTGKATQGIDGIGIIVNNKLCNNVKEIEQLIELNRVLSVHFVLIQTKTSPKFDGKEIDNFFTWVKTFFGDNTSLFKTDEMQNFIEMKDFIYQKSKFMKERNPYCSLYFCSTGKWNNDENLLQVINNNKQELDDLNLFDEVNFVPCDFKKLQILYRKTKEPVEATFTFERKITIPSIEDIKVAYSGMVPFSEFKKIIIDSSGKMKSVFNDNIRDYLEQDDNEVNSDISKTITEGNFDSFCILNNGVTVVADSISGPGDNITITNYQIVNGCQTSNVLYENRNVTGIDAMHIPLKIIVTDKTPIKSQITRATNNQTAVDAVELEALTEFQRNLELFYNATPKGQNKLYYERRTNQYKNSEIPMFRIVNRETQIKVFASMFLNRPHLVAGYYGKLIKDLGEKIFNEEHDYLPYYTSALTYVKLDYLYNNGNFDKSLKRYRYHLMLIFRFLVTKQSVPTLKDKKKQKVFCDKIIKVLSDRQESTQMFEQSVEILQSSELKIDFKNRGYPERKGITDKIIEYLKDKYLRE